MKFWFNLHPTREEAKVLKERAVAFLAARGSEAVEDPREADFAVSIGGDGSVVAAHQACARPIIGVNAGTLGYLPRIEPEQLEEAFGRILAGDYALESRMTLSAGERGGETVNALNDVALTKADPGVLRERGRGGADAVHGGRNHLRHAHGVDGVQSVRGRADCRSFERAFCAYAHRAAHAGQPAGDSFGQGCGDAHAGQRRADQHRRAGTADSGGNAV